MSENAKIEVALYSLNKVDTYIKAYNLGRAFAHYLVYLELLPDQRSSHAKRFCEILHMWGILLEGQGKDADLDTCYVQGIKYFPFNAELLTNYSIHLIRRTEYEKAKKYLKVACSVSNQYLPAEKYLMTARGSLVERWHFPMLNDFNRNNAYYRAILHYSDVNNAVVWDIGTGCGLLSLFASRNKNFKVVRAIEASETLFSIAKNVFIANNMSNITLYHKLSTNMHCDDLEKGNLLITEIFDVALFGEGILEVLVHAWEKLLVKNAKIIPAAATLYVVGIECLDLLKDSKLVIKHSDLNFGVCVHSRTKELYESINLKLVNHTELTEIAAAIEVDFSNLTQLKELLCANYLKTLKVVRSGRLDAFAVWFDLTVDDNNVISTNPHTGTLKCWEQGVIFLNHSFDCNIGMDIPVNVQYANRLLIYVPSDSAKHVECTKVGADIVAFLNDDILISALDKLYDPTICGKDILDLWPFPYLGLRYAKNGSNKCYYIGEDKNDGYIEDLCTLNNVPLANMINLKKTFCSYVIPNHRCTFDIILQNLVDRKGTISECRKDYFQYKQCLKPGGVMYPEALHLYCQMIESYYLRSFHLVNDAHMFGFNIANYINKYSVNEHFDLEKYFQHTKLGPPHYLSDLLLQDCYLYQEQRTLPTPDLKKADALLYWFEITLKDNIKIDTSQCTFYNYACFFVDKSVKYQVNDEVMLNVKLQKGHLKLHFNS